MDPNTQVVATINDYPDNKFNRLFPSTVTQLSPLHKVMVNIVSIDPEEGKGEVYLQKSTGGFSLSKISCLKLMTAANVVMEESKTILPQACQKCVEIARMTRLAPQCAGCSSREDVAFQVSILVPEPSGGYRRYVATKEISKQQFIAKNGGAQKAPVEHMAAQCETKALLRALRAGLGIKGAYSKEELKKPFAVALVVLNTTDPDLKAALIQRYAAGENALFGGNMQQLSSPNLQLLPGGRSVDTSTGEVLVTDDDNDEDTPINGSVEVLAGDEAPPWEQRHPGEDPFENALTCGHCARIIEDTGGWKAQQIADYSKKAFDSVLCPDCQKKARASAPRGGGNR